MSLVQLQIALSLIMLPFFSVAQGQGNVWYFGDNAGIDFNTGEPVASLGGQVAFSASHSEGSSSICNHDGQLLFYTNGEKIWNKNHQIMVNGDGLLGSWSSTQSSLIVPEPDSDTRYFVFTTDGFTLTELQNGFRYSIVDMCLDEDNGAVLSDFKNIHLLDTVAEKLVAVRHFNETDYWIVVHKYWSNAFHAFLLTADGLTDEVISNVGYIHEDNSPSSMSSAIGQMKISSDGGRLTLCISNRNPTLFEVFDFDNSTGTVSNSIQIPTNGLGTVYGVEFSPDNSKLYLGAAQDGIFQVDLSAGNDIAVINSVQLIADPMDKHIFGLQLGPDGKIYAANSGDTKLGVVNYPNNPGLSCDYSADQISLNGKECSYGLPSFIAGYDYSATGVCDTGVRINEVNLKEISLRVFPNPSSHSIRVEVQDSRFQLQSFTITNMLGHAVLHQKTTANENNIDVSGLASGLYTVAATFENGQTARRRLVVH